MQRIEPKVAGPGARTFAQVVYEPRSDKPTGPDFSDTIGEPLEALHQSSKLAHELIQQLTRTPGVSPMTAVYALAHAFADVALAIGGESCAMTEIESIAEVGMPALFAFMNRETRQELLEATILSVLRVSDAAEAQSAARTQAPQEQPTQARETFSTFETDPEQN